MADAIVFGHLPEGKGMDAIRFPSGNKVTVELTPNDLLRARIVFRAK